MKLQPCDVLVEYDGDGKNLFRWVLGNRRTHVTMYAGSGKIAESISTGPQYTNADSKYGWRMTVVRFPLTESEATTVLAEAINIINKEKAPYGWSDLPGEAQHLLVRKFLGIDVSYFYIRDKMYICSEFVAECFWRAKVKGFPLTTSKRPLPEHFLIPEFIVADGKLGVDITW